MSKLDKLLEKLLVKLSGIDDVTNISIIGLNKEMNTISFFVKYKGGYSNMYVLDSTTKEIDAIELELKINKLKGLLT